jgi:ribonuclease VapC
VLVNTKSYLLDTSAVLTLIENESGADRVEQVMRAQSVIISWISLLEVTYVTLRKRGRQEADQRYALLKALPVTLLWVIDEPTLLTAARFKAECHLSSADTFIAACAVQQRAVLLHKDPEFEVLAGYLEMESLPYKTSRGVRRR